MDSVMNKTQFAMKRCRDEVKAEKKQLHVSKKMSKKMGVRRGKKQSNTKRFAEDLRQHKTILKKV